MPANLENSAVATGLKNVSFHSNPKEEKEHERWEEALREDKGESGRVDVNCTHSFQPRFIFPFFPLTPTQSGLSLGLLR